jgi:hypothetical protein
MPALPTKLKPAPGFSHFIHIGLTILLPILVYIMIRMGFVQLALSLVLISKWRMFAVRPRYWPANIRANAIDIIVGVSFVLFMARTDVASWQLVWAVLYGIWLIFIKPNSSALFITIQAAVGQTLGLVALFLSLGELSLIYLVLGAWAICYLAARHFLTAFDEPHSSLYAHVWGYFAAALVWVLGHWLLFYSFLAQPALLLSVIGFGCATLYYLDETDRLSLFLRRQFVFIMVAVIVVVLVFSDWGDKAV